MADKKKPRREPPAQEKQPEKQVPPEGKQPRRQEQIRQEQKEMPLEEQMIHRQSAPRPTAMEEAAKAQMPVNGMELAAVTPVIGAEEVRKAQQILLKYKEGKANLEQRIVENEQWFKLRHWDCLRRQNKEGKEQVEPTSGWLFNAIANKHADAMDNFPSPIVLPREESDQMEAEMLSSIIPVVLEQNEFEEVYDNVWDYKLRSGTGIYGVFWDKDKLHGMGDISVRKIDIINLFWESGITDIQMSRNLFHVQLQDNETLEAMHPQLRGKLSGSPTMDVSKYIYDDSVDTTGKSCVVDWYYKKMQGGRLVLHYVKYVGDTVLYATENEPEMAQRGLYDHGLYPFVFDPMFSVEGTPCGFSFIDVGKSAQEYIDRGNQAILMNMLANSRPRYFVRKDGAVNEEEYLDMTKPLVHVDGNLGQDSVLPIQGKPLSNVYVQILQDKIDELKEVTGNRDVSTGGTSSGATAASAIAAMQEAGSKLSRDNIKASYRAFRKVCLMIIELIRQFYDLPRCFRIMGEDGAVRYKEYSNAGLVPQIQAENGEELGVQVGYRTPMFDIQVIAQKASPYSRMSQNEMALQFYQAGMFNPQLADQALLCLGMMDFEGKQKLMKQISRNGTMFQQLMMMQQMLNQLMGTPQTQEGEGEDPAPGGEKKVKAGEALGGSGESSVTKNARQRVANSTAPA